MFHIRAPQGGRLQIDDRPVGTILVSIHVPKRGRHRRSVLFPYRPCFNPRPQAGTTRVAEYSRFYLAVSIHVPKRGRRTQGRTRND